MATGRITKWIADWGLRVTPFWHSEIHSVMKEPGGVYITAFCQSCRRRSRHKIWMKRVRLLRHERYAYCLACGVSWRYTGYRLGGLKNLD
jgi:hypothetical protein